MKFIVPTILLVCLFALSASLQVETKSILCSACKFLWKEVKKELPVAAEYEEKDLKQAVKNVCHKYTGSIPLVDKLCDDLGDDALTDVYNFIISEDKQINPDKICAHLKKC